MTETNDLTFPPDASYSELNCDINKKGWRERRPGLDYFSSGSTLATIAVAVETSYVKNSYTWRGVAGEGDLNFEVIQIGPTLYFFDHDSANPTAKGFTVNLVTYQTEANVGFSAVQFTSNKGYLFVAGQRINPFYVTYNVGLDSITVVPLSIKVRDLEGLDDGLATDNRPTTLSTFHRYNLYNQGWNTPNIKHEGFSTLRTPLQQWELANVVGTLGYPSNADLWWSFQSSTKPGVINFDLSVDRVNYYVGNSPAPRGYYIVNPFTMNRSSVSGLVIAETPNTSKRPEAIATFAGRIWYGGVRFTGLSNTLYFSQLIKADDPRAAADCYQINDPTAEELNQLIDTDGGVIDISGAGLIRALVPIESGLLVFANNGIWIVGGTDGGAFKPGDFSVKKLSGTGIENQRSIVLVEGTPYWWDRNGIKVLTRDSSGLNLTVESLSDPLIKTFYDALPSWCKELAKGAYDPYSQKITWIYNDATNNDLYFKALVYDLRFKAFTPYTFSDTSVNHKLVDVTAIPVLTTNNNNLSLRDKFLFLSYQVSGSNYLLKIATLRDMTNWKDFFSINGGESFSSYLETGPLTNQEFLRRKAAPNVFTMFNVITGASCFLSTRWDYATSDVSNKYGTKFQAYRGPTSNFSQSITKHRLRGTGKSVRLRFEAEAGKNFQLTGWAIQYIIDNKY